MIGTFMGLAGFVLNYIKAARLRIWAKLFYGITCAIGYPVAAQLTGYSEFKYVGMLFFGYFSYRVWGEDKPSALLTSFWFYIQPFLFATVGATILFSQLNPHYLGFAVIIIICGLIPRIMVAYLATADPKFTKKERVFMASTWIPKATIQAAQCLVFLQ